MEQYIIYLSYGQIQLLNESDLPEDLKRSLIAPLNKLINQLNIQMINQMINQLNIQNQLRQNAQQSNISRNYETTNTTENIQKTYNFQENSVPQNNESPSLQGSDQITEETMTENYEIENLNPPENWELIRQNNCTKENQPPKKMISEQSMDMDAAKHSTPPPKKVITEDRFDELQIRRRRSSLPTLGNNYESSKNAFNENLWKSARPALIPSLIPQQSIQPTNTYNPNQQPLLNIQQQPNNSGNSQNLPSNQINDQFNMPTAQNWNFQDQSIIYHQLQYNNGIQSDFQQIQHPTAPSNLENQSSAEPKTISNLEIINQLVNPVSQSSAKSITLEENSSKQIFPYKCQHKQKIRSSLTQNQLRINQKRNPSSASSRIAKQHKEISLDMKLKSKKLSSTAEIISKLASSLLARAKQTINTKIQNFKFFRKRNKQIEKCISKHKSKI